MNLYFFDDVFIMSEEKKFPLRVTDWVGDDVVDPKVFGRFDEAFEYLYDVDCEKYVDERWEEFQKMI